MFNLNSKMLKSYWPKESEDKAEDFRAPGNLEGNTETTE